MRKLLCSNFLRMRKDRLFWALTGFCFFFGAFVYGLAAYNVRNHGLGWLEFNAHANFYMPVLYIGAVTAIFASSFIGTEYADGTIRNKLAVGHDRGRLYLANLVTVVAASLVFVLAHLLAVVLVGVPFAGRASITCVELQPWRLACCLLATVEYGALFTLIPMLDSQKARTVLVSLLTAGLVTLAGMLVYGRLCQPEFEVLPWIQADGTYILKEGPANSKYLSGGIRRVFTWLNACLPYGSSAISIDRNFAFDPRNPLCTAAGTAVLTALGVTLFRKKDIK